MTAYTVYLCADPSSGLLPSPLLPGERVIWPASPPEPAPITMLSHGILGGDGDRPELGAAHKFYFTCDQSINYTLNKVNAPTTTPLSHSVYIRTLVFVGKVTSQRRR